MTALRTAVIVDGTVYPAGTDHTAMPAKVVDEIRSGTAWVGGVAPTLSYTPAGKGRLNPEDLSNSSRLRTALGLAQVSGGVLNVRDYGAKGDGSTDDTAALTAALAAAGPGATVVFPAPSGHYKITNALPVPAGITVQGGGRGCEIRQYNRANKPVFDCYNVNGVTIRGFALTLVGGPLTGMGTLVRAENGYGSCAGVWSNGSSNIFAQLRVKDFAVGVYLSSYDSVANAMSSTMRTDNVVRDMEVSGANFGILFVAQDGLRISDIDCRDAVDSSSGANPLHSIYGSGNSTLPHRNISISNCVTRNITFGCAYQVKYAAGLVMTNMLSENCQGVFNGIDISDAMFSNIVAKADTAGTNGSFTLQKVTTQCDRVSINGLSIHKALDTSPNCATLRCDNLRANDLRFFPQISARSDGYALRVSGVNPTIDGIGVTNVGADRCRGVQLGNGAGYPTSDALISNIDMTGVVAVVDLDATVTGTNVISYDPGALRNLETANAIAPFGGTAPFSLARREHVRTVTVTGGSSPRPLPMLETVTRLVVADATAFTIGSPERATTAKAGMTHEVVIVNGTASPLGAITWNAAYGLRSPLPAPGPSEQHRVIFAYDGTLWREMSRATTVVTLPDALTVGEIVPDRDSFFTNSIAPASGSLYLSYFTADKTETISTLTAFTGNTAAAATPTLCRMGVYSVAANGDLTLVASTPNDTSLFGVINTAAPKGLSSAFTKVAGQRYALAILVVSGAATPTFHGLQLSATNVVNSLVRLNPPTIGRILGQTDLPNTIAAASLAGVQARVAMQLS